MKSFLSALIAILILSINCPIAKSQTNNPVRIAVLDLNGILRNASSTKEIRAQIMKFRTTFEQEIQKEQQVLRDANQELARKRSLLSPEAFAEERQKFEQKVVDVQKLGQKKRKILEVAQNNAMLNVENILNDIVQDVAVKKGFSLVIRRAQTVVLDKNIDITKEVLTELDQRLPTIKVELEKSQQ
ncbi:MAG: hypothetical protein CMF70_06635 [Magnetovibrio sp.]|nr:hypothetical protein [Magnetovibrio sp.]